ncbi:MAG TPA: YHYH domain-containing protein [Thermoanaerobaculia bacterium]|jgi:hypothetical protein
MNRDSSLGTVLTVMIIALVVSRSAQAHGGGLDRNGCHTNRKTGDYHCHGGASSTVSPSAPTRSASGSATPPVRRVSGEAVPVQTTPTSRDRDLTRTAQVLLRALGYEPSLLGTPDERTRSAVRAFQRAEDIDADGLITEYLVLRLAERVAMKCR